MTATRIASSRTPRAREDGRRAVACAITALELLADRLGDEFERTVDHLLALEGQVLTLGIGKSGLAAQKVAATFRSVGLPAVCLSASDALHGDLGMVRPGDLAMLFSKSGGTRELIAILPHLRARSVTLAAIVGSIDSPLARAADLVLDASVPSEGCPLDAAPMASVVVAQALGDALTAAYISARGFTTADFARLHPAGSLGVRLTLTVADVMRRGGDLPSVTAGATLKDAVFEMTRTGYGAVCVLEPDSRLLGLVTDGDVRRALLHRDDLSGVGVGELMTRDPLTVAPGLLLSEALPQLERRTKPYLTAPVIVAGRRCVGLLRLHDVVQAHLAS
ncbi:MAG TPA: KpsF/GutQ family sugar-phosphate isomerase [Solirubrobacteraceae bacterium]|nr:KpsF/GutQ family sugar-phosphate isomerase [Solirubrobacteraceae bacterium]